MSLVSLKDEFQIVLRKIQLKNGSYEHQSVQIILKNQFGTSMSKSCEQKIKRGVANFYGETFFFQQIMRQFSIVVFINQEPCHQFFLALTNDDLAEPKTAFLTEGKEMKLYWEISAFIGNRQDQIASDQSRDFLKIFGDNQHDKIAHSLILENNNQFDEKEDLPEFAFQKRGTLSQKLSNNSIKQIGFLPTAESFKSSIKQRLPKSIESLTYIKEQKSQERIGKNMKKLRKKIIKQNKEKKQHYKLFYEMAFQNCLIITALGLIAGLISASFSSL